MGRTSDKTVVINGILDVLLAGSLLSAALVAPNLAGVLSKSYMSRLDHQRRQRELRDTLHYMKRKQIVVISESDGDLVVSITSKGRKRVYRAKFEEASIPVPERWDKKWRIVIFDIPEKNGNARRVLTMKLKELGFQMIQKSVWVHPFPCLEQIEIIKYVYPEISPHLVLLETDTIDVHDNLVQRFRNLLNLK